MILANELTSNWLKRLGATANSGESRESHSQLSSILDYYNRTASAQAGEIDWASARDSIHTAGVVDKIRAKYEKFLESEYAVDSAVSKLGHATEKMQALDIAMQYNFMLYFVHYQAHLNQLETLRNVGDFSQMSMMELLTLMPGTDVLQASTQEIADLSPEDYTEDGIYQRICTQFSWGTRYIPPFNHSQDAINAVVATLGRCGK